MIKSPEQKKKERHAIRMILLVSQIGITMMVPVFFCVFIGRFVSDKTGQPILFPVILLIGILAGFRSSAQMISRFTGLSFHKDKDTGRDSPDSDVKDALFFPEGEKNFTFPEDDEEDDIKHGGFFP